MNKTRNDRGDVLLLFNTTVFRSENFIFMEIIKVPGSYFQSAFIIYSCTEILFLEFDVINIARMKFYFETIVLQNNRKCLNFVSSKETVKEIEKLSQEQNIPTVIWDRNDWNPENWNLTKEISKNRARVFNENFWLNINEKREILYEFAPSFQVAINNTKKYHLSSFLEHYRFVLEEEHDIDFDIELYEKAIKNYVINYLQKYRESDDIEDDEDIENHHDIEDEDEIFEFENILQ